MGTTRNGVAAALAGALVLAALALPAAPGASIKLLVDHPSAWPGQVVHARTLVGTLRLHAGGPLTAYLVPVATDASLRQVAETRIGVLRPGRRSTATLTFVVPPVRPGSYLIALRCEPDSCAGRSLLPAGPSPPLVVNGDPGISRHHAFVGAVLVVIAAGLAAYARRRQSVVAQTPG
jgi:hypothetical protein